MTPSSRVRTRLLAAAAVAGLGLTLIPSAAVAAVTERDSADGALLAGGSKAVRAYFYVSNDAGISDTRTCDGTLGLGISDAYRDGENRERGDAFDNGLVFEIAGETLSAPETWTVESERIGQGDVVDRAVTAGPMAAAGLRTEVQYRSLGGSHMLRSTLHMKNTGDEAVSVPVTVSTNVGADSGNVVRGSSSGDETLTAADRWVVTSASPGLNNDPVNLHSLAGPGRVETPVEATSGAVFDCAGVEGVGAAYDLRIPAGKTETLMFFNRLAPTATKALRMAERFESAPRPGNALVDDLTAKQRASVVNWDLK